MDFTILFRAAVAASVRRGRRTLQRLGACAKYFCKFRRQMISAPTAHFFVFHFYLLLFTLSEAKQTPQSRLCRAGSPTGGAEKQANEVRPYGR